MESFVKNNLNSIETAVRKVKRRLNISLFIQTFFRGIFFVFLSATIFSLANKLFSLDLKIYYILLTLFFCALIGALANTYHRRENILSAAQKIDSACHLKERISSALLLKDIDRQFVYALIEDTAMTLNKINLKENFHFKKPQYFYKFLLSLTAFVLITYLLPEFNIIKRDKELNKPKISKEFFAKETDKLKKISENLKTSLDKKDVKEMLQISKQLDELIKDFEKKDINRKVALSKYSKLEDSVKLQKNALQEKLKDFKDLSSLESSKLDENLAKSLENLDFNKAQEALNKIKEMMNSNELSDEEKENLQKELNNLAEKMNNNQNLAESLKKIAQALEKNDLGALNDQIMEAGKEIENLSEMAQQMKMLDGLENDLEARMAALSEGKEGLFKGERADQISEGTGKNGMGKGGSPPINKDEKTSFKDTKIAAENNAGKIIGAYSFSEKALKGESSAEYQNAYLEYRQRAEDTISKETIPAIYKDHIRNYFDSITPQNNKNN